MGVAVSRPTEAERRWLNVHEREHRRHHDAVAGGRLWQVRRWSGGHLSINQRTRQ
jgi:hypothetical protein